MKKKIKLFDSLAHPTISGKWKTFSKNKIKVDCSFKRLNETMKKNNIYRALAIGMEGYEGYNHKKFIQKCKMFKNLTPIAGIDPKKKISSQSKEITKIKELGFKGVKIHPRLSNLDLRNKNFLNLLKLLSKNKLVAMICTFPQINLKNIITPNFFENLIIAISKAPGLKVILVHGGCTDLLKYAEFARINNERILLDLSLTLTRYSESSIDIDIKYLFKNLDRIICIGSDYPEVDYKKLKNKISILSKNIHKKKLDNIYFKNLEKFIN